MPQPGRIEDAVATGGSSRIDGGRDTGEAGVEHTVGRGCYIRDSCIRPLGSRVLSPPRRSGLVAGGGRRGMNHQLRQQGKGGQVLMLA